MWGACLGEQLPTASETCGDSIDNDCDGQVDGGCTLPSLTIADVSIDEGNTGAAAMTFVVSLDAPAASDVSIEFATADGTAVAGTDYQASNGTLVFPATSASAQISVNVIGDGADEPAETFTINLSNPQGVVVAVGVATGTITDDDVSNTCKHGEACGSNSECPCFGIICISGVCQRGCGYASDPTANRCCTSIDEPGYTGAGCVGSANCVNGTCI